MSVSLKILERRGITPEKLKALFEAEPTSLPSDQSDKVASLRNRIRSRVEEGMSRNFAEWKVPYALDLAWDVEFQQITPTLVQQFLSKDPNDKEVYSQLSAWGMTGFIEDIKDAKTGQSTGKKSFNIPMFFQIFVPLVKAYTTIRWANICNARKQNPFLKYEPSYKTLRNAMRCEILTNRIGVMAEQLGYYKVFEQAVLKALHYSICLKFITEEWHTEEQFRIATKDDVESGVRTPNGDKAKEGDEFKKIVKEGLRYHLPHPTRFFRDLAHGPSTFNTDSGCSFAGYWRIVRYRELLNRGLWNDKKIPLSSKDIKEANKLFFSTVYSGCTMKYGCATSGAPTPSGASAAAQAGVGAGANDREVKLANNFYGTEYEDQGVLVTEYFEKLIPKDNGLGDYDCPVWFRFLLGGDGCTVLYCAPLPACPVIYYGYDADESRANNASLSLEILPFQDQFSQVLTQTILAAKQNLANVTLIDQNVLDEKTIENIQNLGERFYRFLNIFGFDGRKMQKGQNRPPEVVQGHSLPKANIAELINVLKTILDVLERVLVMSNLEVAQAASHEQTREEIRHLAKSTSSRLELTSSAFDLAMNAWKRQLYWFTMEHGDDDFYGHIPSDSPLTKADLDKMGITYVDNDEEKVVEKQSKLRGVKKHIRVKMAKKDVSLDIWSLVSNRPDTDRTIDTETATTLSVLMEKLMANPITAGKIGGKQALDIATEIAHLAGIRRDFKFHVDEESNQQFGQEQLKAVIADVLKNVKESQANLQQEMVQTMQPIAEKVAATEQVMAQIIEGLQQLGQQSAQAEQIIPQIIEKIGQLAQATQQAGGQAQEADQLAEKAASIALQSQKVAERISQLLGLTPAPSPANDTLHPDTVIGSGA